MHTFFYVSSWAFRAAYIYTYIHTCMYEMIMVCLQVRLQNYNMLWQTALSARVSEVGRWLCCMLICIYLGMRTDCMGETVCLHKCITSVPVREDWVKLIRKHARDTSLLAIKNRHVVLDIRTQFRYVKYF